MVQELLNYNPGLGIEMVSCFVLCFSEEKRDLFRGSCEAVSTLTATAWASDTVQALLTDWGCKIAISPVWPRHWELSDKPQVLIPSQTVSMSPLWGQLNQGMELWQSTRAESSPLLCSLLWVHLWKECGGSPPSVGGLCHALFAHRGPQIAVQWQPGVLELEGFE